MSIEHETTLGDAGAELPLTELGKRIELLRVERQIPKQRLARHAGTSRQQLWRIMTGKCELTAAMRERLCLALGIAPSQLDSAGGRLASAIATLPLPMEGYLRSSWHMEQTLRTLPGGEEGSRLKRALLNELENVSLRLGTDASATLLELRSRVLNGTL